MKKTSTIIDCFNFPPYKVNSDNFRNSSSDRVIFVDVEDKSCVRCSNRNLIDMLRYFINKITSKIDVNESLSVHIITKYLTSALASLIPDSIISDYNNHMKYNVQNHNLFLFNPSEYSCVMSLSDLAIITSTRKKADFDSTIQWLENNGLSKKYCNYGFYYEVPTEVGDNSFRC